MKSLREYREVLYGCRFCPMCKPAGEVANLTQVESHTTRARAIMLWRIAEGIATWRPRDVELLYQSTLDSISQAWCVVDYPVSEYVLAARAEAFAAGLAPQRVREAAHRSVPIPPPEATPVLLLAGEAADLGNPALAQDALRALERAGTRAEAAVATTGALAYSLGDLAGARAQAQAVVELIRRSGASVVVADGAQTLWALRRIYPALAVALPDGVAVPSLSELLADAMQRGTLTLPGVHPEQSAAVSKEATKQHLRHTQAHVSPTSESAIASNPSASSESLALIGRKAFFHDCRAISLAAGAAAHTEAIQPGYRGDEENLGKGNVFDAPRRVLDALGASRTYSVWSRALCKSCGADDGLWLTYPQLAEGLAKQRLQEARRLGAEVIVTDSLLCAKHLARTASNDDLPIRYLPELL